MGNYIYIIIGFVAIYAFIFIYMRNKNKKSKETLSNLDLESELRNAATYRNDYLSKQFAFIQSQLNGSPVDAMTIGMLEHTNKDAVKDAAKDALRSMATLGTVKYNTVQTPKYLILSGKSLHLIDIDAEGEISKHLIFDESRLLNSTIKEVPFSKTQMTQMKYLGGQDKFKNYKLSLHTDEGYLELMVTSIFMSSFADARGTFVASADALVRNYVIGTDFIKQLGEKHNGLKVNYA